MWLKTLFFLPPKKTLKSIETKINKTSLVLNLIACEVTEGTVGVSAGLGLYDHCQRVCQVQGDHGAVVSGVDGDARLGGVDVWGQVTPEDLVVAGRLGAADPKCAPWMLCHANPQGLILVGIFG